MEDIRNSKRSISTIFSSGGERVNLFACAAILAGFIVSLYLLLSRMEYSWNWRIVWEYRRLYLYGLYYTLAISTGAICLGYVLGLAGGIARISGNAFAKEAARLYVIFFRGSPLLIQIYIFYFCLAAAIGYDNPVVIGVVALAAFSGAYIAEIVRAGIESIDRGQSEAALSTGLTGWQTLRYVIFPQAFRRIIPPVTGQFVSLIKDSSLLSVISVRELTKASEVVNATTYKTFEAYLPLALMYLLLTYPLSYLAQALETKLRKSDRA
ncbi:MAG TPA: amino acid ABC transporter permease [Deltaproteobacteria bacterium]|jgi:polar amino acid transport system permease protein|nr:amino acid ABC transporter permease [Deltaproteobacteria bacterium]